LILPTLSQEREKIPLFTSMVELEVEFSLLSMEEMEQTMVPTEVITVVTMVETTVVTMAETTEATTVEIMEATMEETEEMEEMEATTLMPVEFSMVMEALAAVFLFLLLDTISLMLKEFWSCMRLNKPFNCCMQWTSELMTLLPL
jgi:hypothetical protein